MGIFSRLGTLIKSNLNDTYLNNAHLNGALQLHLFENRWP